MTEKKEADQVDQSENRERVSEVADQKPNESRRGDSSEDLETSGTAEESFRAAERMTAGPELNDHGTKAYDARESTGRQATEDWKKKKHES